MREGAGAGAGNGKRICGWMVLLGMAAFFLGITGSQRPHDEKGPELAGTIRMAGSTSMEKLAGALAEAFMEEHPGVTVTIEFVGSSAGAEAVMNGSADIGNLSRSISPEEDAWGIVENKVAVCGIAVCVDPSNPVWGLTKQQLIDIYSGRITCWKDVGGEDLPIVAVGREAGSGTREAFEEMLGLEDRCVYANEMDSAGAVMARVSRTPGAIGYLSLDAANSTVRLLSLDGAEATAANVRKEIYGLTSPYIMATKGEISAQSDLVQAWFRFVYSAEGQGIVENILVPGTEKGRRGSAETEPENSLEAEGRGSAETELE